MENWLGSSLNQIQGWATVREPYSRSLEQRPLAAVVVAAEVYAGVGGEDVLLSVAELSELAGVVEEVGVEGPSLSSGLRHGLRIAEDYLS